MGVSGIAAADRYEPEVIMYQSHAVKNVGFSFVSDAVVPIH